MPVNMQVFLLQHSEPTANKAVKPREKSYIKSVNVCLFINQEVLFVTFKDRTFHTNANAFDRLANEKLTRVEYFNTSDFVGGGLRF